MKVRNSMNVHQEEKVYKTFKGVSKSVPDQTMSLQEILQRYARGLSIDGEKQPIWDEEGLSMGIHPKSLDLVDIQKLKLENKEEVEHLKARVPVSDRRRKEEGAKMVTEPKGEEKQ